MLCIIRSICNQKRFINRRCKILPVSHQSKTERHEKMNLPNEFLTRMKSMLGGEYEAFLKSYEEERSFGLRVNTLKGGNEKLFEAFGQRLAEIPWTEDGFFYDESLKPGKNPLHEAGAYYIQEPSAMLPAELLAAQPGECVLDLCAAPGGKTTKIAADMKGEGLLVANEIHPKRAAILSSNVERMGIKNAVVTNESSDVLRGRFPSFFDKILIDAPCSGEGMFRKDEEARAQWSEENVAKCALRQREILENGAAMLKDGGKIVYSTCTFAPEENEKLIIDFLNAHPEFRLERPDTDESISCGNPDFADGDERAELTFRVWPHIAQGEGHFAAVLRKSGEKTAEYRESVREKCPEEYKKLFYGFADAFLTHRPLGEISALGENLYIMPPCLPSLKGIKVLRFGLHLGVVKKNRFEPSHSLAMALKAQESVNTLELKAADKEIYAYFRGETVPCEYNGWVLVTADGYSAGWGKASGGVLKNHYPKGLRRSL